MDDSHLLNVLISIWKRVQLMFHFSISPYYSGCIVMIVCITYALYIQIIQLIMVVCYQLVIFSSCVYFNIL